MKTSLLLVAEIGFVLVTLIYFFFFLREIKNGIQRTAWTPQRKQSVFKTIIAMLAGWLLFVSVWSLTGIMADFSRFPFNFMPVIIIPLVAIILLTFSSTTKDILSGIPSHRIIRLQSFRIFVEILLWLLFVAEISPVQMSFEGRNFDVLSGLTAPVVALLIYRHKISRTGVIVWNIIGLGLLINIVTIAILSTPSPVRVFMNEPANTIVTYFPVSWLPGLLVPLAYTLHFLSLRQCFIQDYKN